MGSRSLAAEAPASNASSLRHRPRSHSWPHATPIRHAPDNADRQVDLLIVGGTEAGVAAAIQAARLGVPRILLVNDIAWLGGQFTAEGLAAVDEPGAHNPFDKKVYLPRTGLYGELMQRLEDHNRRRYGQARPGHAWTAFTTFVPREGEQIFREMLAPYCKSIAADSTRPSPSQRADQSGPKTAAAGNVELVEHAIPTQAFTDRQGKRLLGVTFRTAQGTALTVAATLTIDASDWGEVIQLAGAPYFCGPDPLPEQEAFFPPAALVPTLMNPLSWCMILEKTDRDVRIPKPLHYDRRKYDGTLGIPIYLDTTYPAGPFTGKNSIYTYRRLLDAHHLGLTSASDILLMNWTTQDYPHDVLPDYLVQQLEADEPGASRRNIVDMTRRQRELVFADAKQHTLGLLYYLQHDAPGQDEHSPFHFKRLALSPAFGTPDNLPFKPYVREALRLDAMHVVNGPESVDHLQTNTWCVRMYGDSIAPFNFGTDFHPLHRHFLTSDRNGPWHPRGHDWSRYTSRGTLPLRALLPREMDGLIGAQKNIGTSHRLSSAIRLHGDGMRIGQAAGAVAAIARRHSCQPREIVQSTRLLRELQRELVTARQGLPTAVWPYWDLQPDHPAFVAAQMLAVTGILPGGEGRTTFDADVALTSTQIQAIVQRTIDAVVTKTQRPVESGLSQNHSVETLQQFVQLLEQAGFTVPEQCLPTNRRKSLTRSLAAQIVWATIESLPWRDVAVPHADVRFLPRGELQRQRILYYLLTDRQERADWYTGPKEFFTRFAPFRTGEHEVLVHDRESLPRLREADLQQIDQLWIVELDHDDRVEVAAEEARVVQNFVARGGSVWLGMSGNDGAGHHGFEDAAVFARALGVEVESTAKFGLNMPLSETSWPELTRGMKELHAPYAPAGLKTAANDLQTVVASKTGVPLVLARDGRAGTLSAGRVIIDGSLSAMCLFHPTWEHARDGRGLVEHIEAERFAEHVLRWLARSSANPKH